VSAPVRARVEVAYVRVSGTAGRETSLAAQEEDLRRGSVTGIARVYRDRAGGLREDRLGLGKLLADAGVGRFTVVRVTDEDRLARFGVGWITACSPVTVSRWRSRTPRGGAGGMEELLADFRSLIATFAGRVYGIRSRQARQRLLDAAVARTVVDDPGGVDA
jgi:putative resolvase